MVASKGYGVIRSMDILISRVNVVYQAACAVARERYEKEVKQIEDGTDRHGNIKYVECRYFMAMKKAQDELMQSLMEGC